MNVGVIRNPNANKNRRNKNPKDNLIKILDTQGFLIETKDINHNLEDAVIACFENNVNIVCTDGGDGTAHYTLTKLIELYNKNGKELPVFAPLMSGTVNFAAKCFGLNGSPAEILKSIVEDKTNKTKNIDVLKINYNEKAMYGLVYGMGAIPNFLEKYYSKDVSAFLAHETSIRKACGLFLKGILSGIFGTQLSKEIIRPIYAGIRTKDYYEDIHTAVVASTVPVDIIGLKPFHGILNEKNGVYIICGNFNTNVLLRNIPNLFYGAKISGEGMYAKKVESIEMKIKENCNLTIDGELYSAAKDDFITLTAGQCVRVPNLL